MKKVWKQFRMGAIVVNCYMLALGIFVGILLLLHPHGALVPLLIVAGLYIIIESILDIQMSVEIGITVIVGNIQNFYLIYCISKAVRNNKIVDLELERDRLIKKKREVSN